MRWGVDNSKTQKKTLARRRRAAGHAAACCCGGGGISLLLLRRRSPRGSREEEEHHRPLSLSLRPATQGAAEEGASSVIGLRPRRGLRYCCPFVLTYKMAAKNDAKSPADCEEVICSSKSNLMMSMMGASTKGGTNKKPKEFNNCPPDRDELGKHTWTLV